MPFNSSQIKLAETLASVFFRKIEHDKQFIHKRIEEWVSTMPKPVSIIDGSSNKEAFAELISLHDKMVETDNYNSIYGQIWPPFVRDEFSNKLEQFLKLVNLPEIEPSIKNLYHFHASVLDRATGDYMSAIRNINKSSKILKDYIEKSTEKLPRYSRNIILNLGHESDFYRRLGKFDQAIAASNDMLSLSTQFARDEDFLAFEKENNFCPIVAWAYYHACEAHLSCPDWDSCEAKTRREYVFNIAFAQKHYEKWTPPTLIQILTNDLWKERYPDYTDKIANLLYQVTAPNSFLLLFRTVSVALGRVTFRIAPASALGALVLLVYLSLPQAAHAETAQISIDARPNLIQIIDTSLQEAQNLNNNNFETVDIEILRENVIDSIDTILASPEPMRLATDNLLVLQDIDDSSILRASPVNGNEHGVGPGISIS